MWPPCCRSPLPSQNFGTKRMHSSRMHTAHSSSHGGGLASSPSTSPLGVGLDQIPLNFPLGCGPGPDSPQLPPWLWAWTRSPSTSPLVVGLETPPDQTPPGTRHPLLWTEFLTHASENITLPQTSFAGGKKAKATVKVTLYEPPIKRITDACNITTLLILWFRKFVFRNWQLIWLCCRRVR